MNKELIFCYIEVLISYKGFLYVSIFYVEVLFKYIRVNIVDWIK